MEEKDKSKQGEELLEVDEKGKAIEKKVEEKKPKKNSETFTYVLASFLFLVLLGLFLKIFIFNKNLEKNNIYHKLKTADDMNRNIGEAIIRLVRKNPKAKIGLATGTTPEGLYKYLINKYEKNEVSFKDVQFFSLDGLCGLPKTDKNSYYYILTNSFLNKIDAQEKNIHLLNEEGSSLEDFEKNAQAYNELLAKNQLDLQLLSFGENGHIGSNEPNTDFDLLTHVVEITPETREKKKAIFGSLEKTPKYAITQGIKNVLQAKEIIAMAKGKGKAKAVNEIVNGVYTKNCPISVLKNHPKATVYTDEEAGELVKEINKKF
jgi:glucosamine-6-phosphate deaminase